MRRESSHLKHDKQGERVNNKRTNNVLHDTVVGVVQPRRLFLAAADERGMLGRRGGDGGEYSRQREQVSVAWFSQNSVAFLFARQQTPL